ncbi:MAG: STAS domain-containing protein [Armatimonadota bacterium]|nr:STAS domain-containing protein [Armatimonadota bacterium]
MTENVEIVSSRDGDTVTVTGSGELDLRKTDRLWQVLEEAVASGDKVVVDLRPALFIDTAALSCLARAGKIMYEQGRRLVVKVKDKTHPRHVLEIVRFEALMDVIVEK